MKNIFNFFIFCLISLFFAQHSQAQCYVRLEDASGFKTDSYQANLQSTAGNLCQIFDTTGFSGQFKVYDFGFYLHQENTTGGYPEPFEQKIAQVQSSSPYYLLFGKQTDRSGIYTRFWVDLKLPDTGRYSCLLPISRQALHLRIEEIANETYNSLNQNADSYSIVEQQVMDSLFLRISEIVNCCLPQNRSASGCQICPTTNETRLILKNLGFMGIRCKVIGPNTDPTPSNITNYGNVSLQDFNLVSDLSEIVTALSSKGDARGYITSNTSICSGTFSNVESLYKIELENDYDVWVHIMDNPGDDDAVYIKFEHYILMNDESLLEQYFAKPAQKGQLDQKFILIQPGNQPKYFLSYGIQPLPPNPEGTPSDDVEKWVHIVQSNESLSAIVALYDNIFSLQDLLNWNPQYSANPDLIEIGDEISLFLEDYNDAVAEETFGLYVPLGFEIFSNGTLPTNDKYLSEKGFLPGGMLVQPPPAKKPIPTQTNPNPLEEPAQADPEKNPNDPEKVNYKKPWPAWMQYTVRGAAVIALILTPSEFGNSSTPVQDIDIANFFMNTHGRPLVNPSTDDRNALIYVTYTKKQNTPYPSLDNSIANQSRLYAGRSSGYGLTPQRIVWLRDRIHQKLDGFGYAPACLDYWTIALKPKDKRRNDPSYWFIRGREQLVIEAVGDSWSQQPRDVNRRPKTELTRSGNRIAGVRKDSPMYNIYKGTAKIFSITPPFDWDGACTN
jgi:hypothetical protein